MSALSTHVLAQLEALLQPGPPQPGAPAADTSPARLHQALRLLAKWRSVLIQNTVVQQQGLAVGQGPFQGMAFIAQSAEGCHVPKLLGCYEQPLHGLLASLPARGYDTVLNVGCAEGYYAVGLARLLPRAQVRAHDLNPQARQACQELARRNGVQDRVQVGGLLRPQDLAGLGHGRTLLVCDIEGAELELLDPSLAPALAGMDILVESHECLRPGITRALGERLASSHHLRLIQDDGQRQLQPMPAWFMGLDHLDQLLATWEWRSGPTPWWWMEARTAPPASPP